MIQADIATAVAAYKATGSKAAAARLLNIPVTTLKDRLAASARPLPTVKGRRELEIDSGVVLVFSDAHFWPGAPSVAHRALVKFCKDLAPKIVVCNGDAIDGASISRHPPIGWESCPTVKEELETCQERLGEILDASRESAHIHLLGNHDARFETRLAQVAPEFKDVHGIHLQDHLPGWTCGWSLFINDNVVVKHRFKGGQHAPYNNTVTSGRSMVTGHLHSAKVTPYTDYNGTRYGVDTGCLADTYHEAFQGYCEDSSRDWRQAFAVLTFRDGQLLMPELVLAWSPTSVQFRGEIIEV
jgi:hypothetical protein